MFGLAACLLPAQASAETQLFSATLREALAHRDKTLTATRSTLPMNNGQSVTNCNGYLDARRAKAVPLEAVDAQLIMSEYLVCEALDLLDKHRPPISPSKQRAHGLGMRLAKQLDLRTVPSSLGPQLDDKKTTLQTLSRRVKTSATAAWIEDKSARISFEIVAQADLDNDGKPDWIVWLADESREGNYRGYVTLIVSDITRKGLLAATAFALAGGQKINKGSG